MSSTLGRHWRRVILPLGLFVWLVLQIAVAWFLLTETPTTRFWGSHGFALSADRQTVMSSLQDFTRSGMFFEQHLGLDLESGQLRNLNRFQQMVMHSEHQEDLLTLDAIYSNNNGKHASRRIVKLDRHSGAIVSETPIDAPGANRILNNRFVVSTTQEAIRVYDSQNPSNGWSELSAPLLDKSGFIFGPADVLWFYRTNVSESYQKATGASTPSIIELFTLDQQNKPQFVAQWPISAWATDPYRSTCVHGNMIAQIGSDLSSIEFRSTTDGSLVKSLKLPDGINLSNLRWSLSSDRGLSVSFDKGWKVLDLDSGQWKRTPENYQNIGHDRQRGLMLLVQNQGEDESYLIAKEDFSYISKPCKKNDWPLTSSWPIILDESSLLAISYCYGVSILKIDVESGRVVQWYRPLWYVPVLLFGLLFSFGLWSWAWCRWSLSVGGWAWIDSLIIGLIPLILVVCRFAMAGVIERIERPPVQYAQAIFYAFSLLCIGWAILGRARWSLRILPCCIWFSAFLWTVCWVFQGYAYLTWIAIRSAWPITIVAISIFALRLIGFRYTNSSNKMTNGLGWITQKLFHNRIGGRPQIIDLVLLTSVMALLASAVRITPPIEGALNSIGIGELLTVCVGATLPLAFYFSALTRRKRFFVVGCVITGFLTVLLVIDPIAEFTFFVSGWGINLGWLEPVRFIAGFCAASFILALPFRMRGWNIERGVQPSS